MAEKMELKVNGEAREVSVEPDTPLLYVLMNDLELKGPKFGCGLAQCGACSVLIDGQEMRSCVYPVSAAQGRDITTSEGLGKWHSGTEGEGQALHPVQEALIEEQAPQCGYCYNGMAVKAAELLAENTSPSDAEIVEAMNGHLCRCGTYPRIKSAIRRAADKMGGQSNG